MGVFTLLEHPFSKHYISLISSTGWVIAVPLNVHISIWEIAFNHNCNNSQNNSIVHCVRRAFNIHGYVHFEAVKLLLVLWYIASNKIIKWPPERAHFACINPLQNCSVSLVPIDELQPPLALRVTAIGPGNKCTGSTSMLSVIIISTISVMSNGYNSASYFNLNFIMDPASSILSMNIPEVLCIFLILVQFEILYHNWDCSLLYDLSWLA